MKIKRLHENLTRERSAPSSKNTKGNTGNFGQEDLLLLTLWTLSRFTPTSLNEIYFANDEAQRNLLEEFLQGI